jgi:hypothetical protein
VLNELKKLRNNRFSDRQLSKAKETTDLPVGYLAGEQGVVELS